MSLIIDATKAAEREKQRRAAAGSPVIPLLVPLRSKPAPEFSWRRALALGLSGAVLLSAGSFAFLKTRDARQQPMALVSPPLIGVIPSGDTALPGSATQASAPAAQPVAPTAADRVSDSPPQRAAGSPDAPRAVVSAPVARPSTDDMATARPQGEPAAVEQPSTGGGGRLRIAVDAREANLAQLFADGVAAHRAGQLETARATYERVLAAAPNHVDALNNMGVLLSATRELERAESILRRVVRLSPENAGAWNNLGTALAQRGQTDDAIAAFQRALTLDPAQVSARVSLAQQYLAIGSLAESKRLLEEVVATDPLVPEAHYALGQVLEREQDWVGAIRSYQAFVRTAPGRLAGHVEHVRRRIETLSARVR